MKKSFQIVVSAPSRTGTRKAFPLSRFARLKMLLQGFLVAAFAIGTVIAVLFIASTIALVLWIAAVIALAGIIAVVAFRSAVRKRVRMPDDADHDQRG